MIVESTGTGAGIKLFCGGVGEQFPDMVNASRPMKASEYADCAKAGAKKVIEVPIGIDGLTLIQAKGQPALNLTVDRHLQGARRQPVRQAADRADLEGRQSGASGDQDPRPRPAADSARATAWPS